VKRVISHLKAQRMVEKGCLAYLAFVRDVITDTPIVNLVPVGMDFPDVIPAILSCMSTDGEINFGIDLVSGLSPSLFHYTACNLYS